MTPLPRLTPPVVYGVDLSLSATGIAGPAGETTIAPAGLVGAERLDFIRREVARYVSISDLVVVEGYAYGRANQAHQLGELGGLIRWELWRTNVEHLIVPPTKLKTYATGAGNAGKDQVLASAIRRLGYGGHDHNEADALWLRALGMDLLGHPLVELPQNHRRALDGLETPDAVAS